jgi:hypothetical protein
VSAARRSYRVNPPPRNPSQLVIGLQHSALDCLNSPRPLER